MERVTISSRIRVEYADKIREMSMQKGCSMSAVIDEIYQYYFDKQADEEHDITVITHDHCINMLDCRHEYAMILEVADKMCCTNTEAFKELMKYVIAAAGEPEERYINKAMNV